MNKDPICRMEFTKDASGKEILLKDGKFQVMMEWEKPYMHACIDALKPFGDVLEVGFGCGYSATRIQHYHPKSHTIIEFHPVVAKKAREFAKHHPNVTIIEDTWQNALKHLNKFDTIFFDDYPLESDAEMKELEQKKIQSHHLLQKGSEVIAEIENALPFLKEIVYTDADIEEFIGHLMTHPGITEEHLIRFLFDLEQNRQITASQKDRAILRLKEKGLVKNIPSKEPTPPQKAKYNFRGPNDRLFTFLRAILNNHMRSGSRFSCFLSSAESKFEDDKFFQEVILNPHLDYHEERIPIEVPPNCDYYTDREALVITITKRE
jgi:hypothetical protein